MVYTAYTFKNAFQYRENDVYWCTADIGWITGHSYIVYGPLANGATTVMFEGVPSYPDYGRFWDIVQKHKVSQFYTAPTAIRALAKQGSSFIDNYDLSTLKVLGSVGEPINEEAWHWYNENIGKKKSPIVDYLVANRNRWNNDYSYSICNTHQTNLCNITFYWYSTCLMDENAKN